MSEEKKPITADFDLFFEIEEFEAHLQYHIDGTPLAETLTSAVKRVKEAGGKPRGAALPGKPAVAPDEALYICGECGGSMTYRKGTSKAGKPYKGWFCAKRNCKGTPIWDDDE